MNWISQHSEWLFGGVGIFIGFVGVILWRRTAIRRVKQETVSELPTAIGNFQAQQQFIRDNAAFLREYPNLHALLEKIFLRTLSFPEQGASDAESDIERENIELTQLSVFYLGRIAADDFGELLILAGNGKGVGAYKILRGMYERIVTAAFLAKNPSEARIFVEHSAYQRGQIWNRLVEIMPEMAKRYPPEKIQQMLQEYEDAKAKLKATTCSKCGQPISQEAWTRRALDTMAEKTDMNFKAAYLYCYLIPTFHSHATAFGIDARLYETESGAMAFKETTESDARQAVLYAHGMILRLVALEDQFFGLGLGDEIARRTEAFQRIWDTSADPQPAPPKL